MEFTQENITKIFGHEAAEDDNEENLYNFYVKGAAYKTLKNNLPLYILVGHKGCGKSALLKILETEEKNSNNLPINIRPDDIFTQTETDINKMIYLWQENLSKIIFDKLIENLIDLNRNDSSKGFKTWLSKFSKLTLNILGKKFADIHKYDINITYKNFLALFKDVIFTEKQVTVFIDDLDRGWKNEPHEIKNISAMFNALRTINRNIPNVKFRVALRSSVYFAVRTSDESTDKIESSVIWLKWSNHDLLTMLVKRIILFVKGETLDENKLLAQPQALLGQKLDYVFEACFQGKGHWANAPTYRVLLSLIRQRPRDLVKLCTLAATEAYNKSHNKIMTSDLENSFRAYSNGRLTDTVNEYSSELKDDILKRILLEMKPSAKKQGNPFVYSPSELSVKMKQIIEHIGKAKFNNGDIIDEKNLPVFLYKINFLTVRKDTPEQIIRFYFDESNYIVSENVDFGFNVEVHPAYRWVLQPNTIGDIYEQIALVS